MMLCRKDDPFHSCLAGDPGPLPAIQLGGIEQLRGFITETPFNIREGIGMETDTLPDRLFEPLESGVYRGVAIPRDEFEAAIRLYYQMRGWDEQGCPTPGALYALDIGWIVSKLHED